MPPVHTGKRRPWAKPSDPHVMSGPEWWRLYAEAGSPDDLDARSVPCPICHADAGRYCKRPSGHKATDAHARRWDDAVIAAVIARDHEGREGTPIPDEDGFVPPPWEIEPEPKSAPATRIGNPRPDDDEQLTLV